jgi:SAM-dependent methyltransferase
MSTTNYNLQPYGPDGETTGRRTVEWFARNVIWPAKNLMAGRALDIGCGNGRFNRILAEIFDDVVCIDPICEIGDANKIERCAFEKCHFSEFNGEPFDFCLFLGSWNIIFDQYGSEVFDILYKNLEFGGRFLVTHEKFQSYRFDYVRFKEIKSFETDKTIVRIFLKR